MQRVIRTTDDVDSLGKFLKGGKFPVIVDISTRRPRTLDQNRLQRLWLNEAASQGDHTAEEYRGYCKLHGGIPILRAECDEFREAYDRLIRPRPYQEKLELMQVPLDFPVTRLMTTVQHKRYLDWMYEYFTGLGYELTNPR